MAQRTLEERLSAVETELAAVKAQLASNAAGRTAAATLPSVNIDNEHGDPVVRKDPPRWKGVTHVGSHYSMCPPGYLRELAGFLQWKAGKELAEGKEKYSGYSMLDAARALAHADRIEQAGAKQSDIPF